MNGNNLNKHSETDWARLEAMTDEEIDTSDILLLYIGVNYSELPVLKQNH